MDLRNVILFLLIRGGGTGMDCLLFVLLLLFGLFAVLVLTEFVVCVTAGAVF
jgi:hypothetical protein